MNYQYQKIKERRKKLNLTQKELADKAHIAREYLSNIENGKNVPTATVIIRIANALKVKVSYFFN